MLSRILLVSLSSASAANALVLEEADTFTDIGPTWFLAAVAVGLLVWKMIGYAAFDRR